MKANKKIILKDSSLETTNLALVNSLLKTYFPKELVNNKTIDFTGLRGEQKEAFIKDMNKARKLITEGYNSTMEFISYCSNAVKIN